MAQKENIDGSKTLEYSDDNNNIHIDWDINKIDKFDDETYYDDLKKIDPWKKNEDRFFAIFERISRSSDNNEL